MQEGVGTGSILHRHLVSAIKAQRVQDHVEVTFSDLCCFQYLLVKRNFLML